MFRGVLRKDRPAVLIKPSHLANETFKEKLARLKAYANIFDDALRDQYVKNYRRFNSGVHLRLAIQRGQNGYSMGGQGAGGAGAGSGGGGGASPTAF
jgi:uncharacterized membrane protein YgcG